MYPARLISQAGSSVFPGCPARSSSFCARLRICSADRLPISKLNLTSVYVSRAERHISAAAGSALRLLAFAPVQFGDSGERSS